MKLMPPSRRNVMSVQLSCSCGKLLRVRDDLAGKRIKCPSCGASLFVKEASPKRGEEAIDAKRERRGSEVGEEDRPRASRRKKQADNKGLLIALVSAGALLVLGGGVLAIILLSGGRSGDDKDGKIAKDNKSFDRKDADRKD